MIVTAGEAERIYSDWQVPPFEQAANILPWVEEQVQEGEGWLSGQPAYKNLSRNMAIYDGLCKDNTRSTLITNFLGFNLKKFVETISDIREICTYGSDAPQFKEYANLENRVAKAIYTEAQYPRQLAKVLKYAAAMSVGYTWVKCKAEDYGRGERQIMFSPLGILDVVPIQVPKETNDVQDAYAVTVFEYMPVAEAHARFPLFQSELKPVDQTRYDSHQSQYRLAFQQKCAYNTVGDQPRNWGNLYCEIRYTYVRDMRINTTGFELPMGDANTSWFHKVPFVGQQILGGIKNGQPFMRPAENEDCWVYPNLRLIVSNANVSRPMYDGPAWDWHGKIPVVQLLVDEDPWRPLGKSLTDNVASIETTKRKHERAMDQILTVQMDPPLGYDRQATGGPKIENFDMFESRQRAGVDGEPKKILQSILPEEVQVREQNFKFHELLTKMEEQQLGINDVGALLDLKLNMSSDSIDKALDPIGPLAKAIASAVERHNANVGYMLKFMIPQWYDTRRIVSIVGPNNLPEGVMDFDPNSLIPSHGEDEYESHGVPIGDGLVEMAWRAPMSRSKYDKLERARRFARNLRLASVPSTLNKLTQVQEQTKLLALKGRGAPLSWHTVLTKLGVENVGEIQGNTEFEKWVNEEKLMLFLKAQAAKLAAELGLGEAPEPSGKQHAGGRPPTDKKPGKQVMKDKSTNPRPVTKTAR